MAGLLRELGRHVPFTAGGTLLGVAVLGALAYARVPASVSSVCFWVFHPLHVFLSALVTTSVYRRVSGGGAAAAALIGFAGSVGIGTLSDSIIPFIGEWLVQMPNRGLHIGFIEKWWLVNPLAACGIALGMPGRGTRLPHAGHVFLSTVASLFHLSMALGGRASAGDFVCAGVFLFLSVWIPCCTSDIVFPVLAASAGRAARAGGDDR